MKVIEIAGIGPVPMCAMLLADMGAEIIRVDRLDESDLGISVPTKYDLTSRGRRSIAVNLKSPRGAHLVRKLVSSADILLEGFRPGVMERLGLGPDDCFEHNNRLVYGRMTGWGQAGPLAQQVGHDPNYVALSGALAALGSRESGPIIPLSLLGDFAGGSLYLAMGVLAAIIEARSSGQGQVVDAAILDGVTSLMTGFYGLMQADMWRLERESNFLDGGAHFCRAYETKDGRFIVIAPIERKFYHAFLEHLGLDPGEMSEQYNPKKWPEYSEKLSQVFLTRTQEEWCDLFEGTDTCVSPVLTMDEALKHEHAMARNNFTDINGVVHPAPAPRFSRTVSEIQSPPVEPGTHTLEVLREAGMSGSTLDSLLAEDIIRQHD